ncbi:MAG: four helix bundle protein [Bacteroidetes bacterium]|nr:four helix bundle protein [Bacteroidota bacterium]
MSAAERRHFFHISRGSSFESAAVLDILHRMNQLSLEHHDEGKALLLRISSMLTRLARNQR